MTSRLDLCTWGYFLLISLYRYNAALIILLTPFGGFAEHARRLFPSSRMDKLNDILVKLKIAIRMRLTDPVCRGRYIFLMHPFARRTVTIA